MNLKFSWDSNSLKLSLQHPKSGNDALYLYCELLFDNT